MRKRSSKPKLPRDVNQRAKSIVDHLTRDRDAEPSPETPSPSASISQAAAAPGHRGGLKGGPARAAKLSKKRRSEIARKAAQARRGELEG